MRFIKTNWLLKKIFSNQVWDIPNNDKKVYLTFDDGPTPEITNWVLSELKKHNAKATFFCIGDNIRKYPIVFEQVFLEKHSIGNHTFNHLNGWKTKNTHYLKNIELCEKQLQKSKTSNLKSKIFRPPYGKIKPSQSSLLRKLGFKIIMWDVISYDFDNSISKEQCLQNVVKNIKSGSIIVFHDSVKAFENLKYVLPKTLVFLSENGFICEAI